MYTHAQNSAWLLYLPLTLKVEQNSFHFSYSSFLLSKRNETYQFRQLCLVALTKHQSEWLDSDYTAKGLCTSLNQKNTQLEYKVFTPLYLRKEGGNWVV